MKQKEIEFLLDVAKRAAEQSYAIRLKVGGVVTDALGNMIAYGYNGTPRGMDNNCENRVYDYHENHTDMYYFENKIDSVPYRLVTKDSVIHCEHNLIAHAARRGISINNGMMFLTHSPCERCTAMIIQTGITDVFFLNKYRTFDQVHSTYQHKVKFHHESL